MQTFSLLLMVMGCLLLGTASAQQVYKCLDANGQTVFQHHACASGRGMAIEVPPMNIVEGNPAGERGLRAEAARSAAAQLAIARGYLIEGMTESEMRQVLGSPTVVNTDRYGDLTRQQFVYKYPDGSTRYVYSDNGLVRSVQERPAAPRVGADPCLGMRGEDLRRCRR